jgi:hypothetical protein
MLDPQSPAPFRTSIPIRHSMPQTKGHDLARPAAKSHSQGAPSVQNEN